MDRNRIIRTASIIGVAGNALLAAAKIVIGLVSGSYAVLGDGFDSCTDIFISIITLAVSVVIARPPDREHPYGHFRAETIATAILSFVIFFIGGALVLTTVEKLFTHGDLEAPGKLSVVVTVISIVGKGFLAFSQFRLGKKSGSALLVANGKNMRNDIITSAGVLVGLAALYLFNIPLVDKILALAIGGWIMFTAVRIFRGTVTEMMEGEVDMDLYNRIFAEVKAVPGLGHPHRVRIRKVGFHHLIDMDVEVDGRLTVTEAHDKVMDLERRVKAAVPTIYDIVIHMEPEGNVEHQERWGLSERQLK
ncbi:MAG: cation transporter [Spirochaetales bacterium]|nr:cation transporter [Spirochaetales bacterium]